MRIVSQTFLPAVLVVLLGGFAASAFALSSKQSAVLLKETSCYARMALQKAEDAPREERRALYAAVMERIDHNLAQSGTMDAKALADWGELCVQLAKKTSGDVALAFLDKAVPIFEKARDLDRGEEHAWAGLAEGYFVRADKLVNDGHPEEARKQVEAGTAVYKEGEKHCPNGNYLFYMWGSNLVLRAYDVKGPERRALREEGLARFSRAAEIDPSDRYSLRMAGTACLRMAGELPASAADEREQLLRRAEAWYKRAFAHDPEGTCSHLGKVQAMLRDEAGLRATLEHCAHRGCLPDLDKRDFNFVRDKEWFQALTEENEKPAGRSERSVSAAEATAPALRQGDQGRTPE